MNRKHRGQALVELALILPLLLAIFFGIIDAAFLIQGYITVNHAAREAARFAVAYQPVQGECYDYNGDGLPNDGSPWCPTDANETEAAYHNRRVAMIKQIALDESRGLRISGSPCMDAACIQNNIDSPGSWGVRVWGFPSFTESETEDHPGLQGLPVRVQVVHNVQLVVFSSFLPRAGVPVAAATEMVNEGIQVGWGNQPPPAFSAPPPPGGDPGDPGGDPGDPPPEGPEPTQLYLNFDSAVNQLPDDTSHDVVATVTDDDGTPVQGVRVIIQSDAASFSIADITQEVQINTLANGKAATTIHSVVPALANIVAWADLDGDGNRDTDEPSDSAVKEWVGVSYSVSLNFEQATNLLPDEREHVVVASVTAPGGDPVAAAPVKFRIDGGSFHVSGTGITMDVVKTDAAGDAITAIYANEPLTATIEAWIDYDNNNDINGDEPFDTAVKVWEVAGPYLVVTNHNPEVLEVIAVDVMDHPPGDNPYSLWWCPTSITSTDVISQLVYPVNVDVGTSDLLGVSLEVPAGSAGLFRLETHKGDGGADGCAETDTLVAYSADIKIRDILPDLEIIDMQVMNQPDELVNGSPITVNLTLRNNTPSQVLSGPFDVDVYLDLEEAPPPTKLGDDKQWLDTLGPFETKVITAVLTGDKFGTNQMWAQVDTSLYVNEGLLGGEDNNVYGPVEVELECGVFDSALSDDFDGGLNAAWAEAEVDRDNNDYDDGYYYVQGDQLHIVSHGDKIGNWNDDFFFIYQGVSGDFDARVRVIQGPTTSSDWAKTGLMSRESTANDSPMASNAYRGADRMQGLYRTAPGVEASGSGISGPSASLPVWLRLVRRDNEYSYYWTDVSEPEKSDWSLMGTRTIDRDMGLLGLTNASYDDNASSHVILDDFQVCASSGGAEIRPPGYRECTELIRVPGFEGNPETVYEYWQVGRQGTYDRGTVEFYRGSFSMRLHASLGVVPCTESNLEPYIYQTVEFPQEIQSFSTLVVNGFYFVSGSDLPCSYPNVADADDDFLFTLKEWDGTTVYTDTLMTGGNITGTWLSVPVTPTETLDLTPYAGQMMRLHWAGTHDGDFDGTFFYMDEISAQLCTEWPIPDKVPGMAVVGGRATTQGEQSVTVILPGADVWAYGRGGGDVYHTQAIQDGTYHFYNIPPGEYVIYAEALVGGVPRYAMVTISIAADEEVHDLNLFLE